MSDPTNSNEMYNIGKRLGEKYKSLSPPTQTYIKIIACGIILIIISSFFNSPTDKPKQTDLSKVEKSPIPLPVDQRKFSEIVAVAQSKSIKSTNEMQIGGIKSDRDKLLCQFFNSRKNLKISDWDGIIEKIGANSDGKGIISIRLNYTLIPEGETERVKLDVKLGTRNNSISDFADNTLLEPGTPLFSSISNTFSQGMHVRFSGEFKKDSENECIKEKSLSLKGKVIEPAFVFQFYDLKKYEDKSPLISDCTLNKNTRNICHDKMVVAWKQCALKDMGEIAMQSCKTQIAESNNICCRKDITTDNIRDEVAKVMFGKTDAK